nr:hypothetical protein [uncultured Dethiosulfovibrio sp.]
MLARLNRFLLGSIVAILLSTGAFAYGSYPVLITKPDYDDGHTAPDPSDDGTYFLTADGYPVVRDSRGDWLYMVNNTPMVLMPFGDGYIWAPAAGPAVAVVQVVQAPIAGQGSIRVEPSWYTYSLPNNP